MPHTVVQLKKCIHPALRYFLIFVQWFVIYKAYSSKFLFMMIYNWIKRNEFRNYMIDMDKNILNSLRGLYSINCLIHFFDINSIAAEYFSISILYTKLFCLIIYARILYTQTISNKTNIILKFLKLFFTFLCLSKKWLYQTAPLKWTLFINNLLKYDEYDNNCCWKKM